MQQIRRDVAISMPWNSANSFIFYGKSGEISTNNLEDQELSVLCLHLLQNCLVYVNTLMIQQILTKPHWEGIMVPMTLEPCLHLFINISIRTENLS